MPRRCSSAPRSAAGFSGCRVWWPRTWVRPGPMLLVWVLGGLVTLTGALSIAEMAAAFPRSGGIFAYILEVGGPVLGLPLWLGGTDGDSGLGHRRYLHRFSPSISAISLRLSGQQRTLRRRRHHHPDCGSQLRRHLLRVRADELHHGAQVRRPGRPGALRLHGGHPCGARRRRRRSWWADRRSSPLWCR